MSMRRNLRGEQIVSSAGKVLGTITDQYTEGEAFWVVIDEAYEVNATACEYCLDLMGVLRAANPELKPSFVRLKY